MSKPPPPDYELEQRISTGLLDVLIRAGLIGVLAVLCYVVFAPFLTLMAWAVVLAVTLYPLHGWLARHIGGKQGLAATIIVVVSGLLIVAPTVLLVNSFGSSVHDLVYAVRHDTLEIPAPREGIRDWPIIGKKIHGLWSRAYSDLPGLIQSMQPKIGELAAKALAIVASIGVGMLKFLASFVIAGILMAYGDAGARGSRAIFERIIGRGRGEAFARLSTSTIRAVAQGVVGIAFVQAILVGLALLVADVPWAGVLAAITLVLSIAQIPALIVILPAIVYIWSSGHYGTGAAIVYSILLLLSGLADNVLKPLMLGRGVDAPMPVVLLGALGGLATSGILGMFVGATVLTLGYQIFMGWVATDPDPSAAVTESDS
ncbi:MAG TPA: AI-2E family transporter [Methylomirabilota bacterium]|nr:AI-2E family transporter [Methylomirabilota bacterium]